MRERQGSVLETLRRMQLFLDRNTGLLASINASASRRALDDSVTQLTTQAIDQSAGLVASKGETGRQRVLRTTLRQAHMKPIATVARAKLRDVPEFRALQLPDARISTQRLATAAGAMAEAADKHAQVFIDAGLPQDFVAQLNAAAKEATDSIDGRNASRGRRVRATKSLQAQEKAARSVIRVLDSLVVPALGTNDGLISEWKSLKRVSLKPGGSASAPSSDSTIATSSTSSTGASTTASPSTTAAGTAA